MVVIVGVSAQRTGHGDRVAWYQQEESRGLEGYTRYVEVEVWRNEMLVNVGRKVSRLSLTVGVI